jgi:hypothetical protein
MSDAKKTKRTDWPLPPPWLPVDYDVADVVAVQALAQGTADEHQQKRALRWIVEQACGTYDVGWHPEFPDFAAGKRSVGLQIVKLCRINPKALLKDEK